MAEPRIRATSIPPSTADRAYLEAAMAALQDFERTIEPNRLPGDEMAAEHTAALLDWAASNGGGALIAEGESGPQGFLIYGVDEEMGRYVLAENQRYGTISDLFVEPAARGQGIARALIADAEARLARTGIARIEIGVLPRNSRARTLYERLGYAPSALSLAKSI